MICGARQCSTPDRGGSGGRHCPGAATSGTIDFVKTLPQLAPVRSDYWPLVAHSDELGPNKTPNCVPFSLMIHAYFD